MKTLWRESGGNPNIPKTGSHVVCRATCGTLLWLWQSLQPACLDRAWERFFRAQDLQRARTTRDR